MDIATCQFRYPSDGQLHVMQKQCCQGGCHFGISQTELPDCTFRIVDQVYKVILSLFFIYGESISQTGGLYMLI